MPLGNQGMMSPQTVYKVAFDKICSNYLLISGERANLVKIVPSADGSVIRKHLSQCQKK